MIKWLKAVIGLTLVIITLFRPNVAFGLDQAHVVISFTPLWSSGIFNFVITYVSDQQLDMTWSTGDNITNTMIRAKYGRYPSNILADNETPSDGYLVYYGTENVASDTSMNFDDNPGILYYRAWAQRNDGTWVVDPAEGNKESEVVTLLAFVGIILAVGVINFGFLKNSFTPYKLAGALLWMIPIIWVISNPPSIFVAGSPLQTVTLIVLIGIGFISLFGSFRRSMQIGTSKNVFDGSNRVENYESNAWHVPSWISGIGQGDNTSLMRQRRNMDLDEYRRKVHSAMFQREQVRRRGR